MIPDDVEKVVMTKEDYDRNVKQLLYDKINAEQEIERLNNIINELIEDIPCLLEIINRNEKDIKVYQDEWIAIKSLENKLQELKGSDKE